MMTIEDSQTIDISSKNEFYKHIKSIFVFFKLEFKIEYLLLVAFMLFITKQLFQFLQKKRHFIKYHKIEKEIKDQLFSKYLQTTESYSDKVAVGDLANMVITESLNGARAIMTPIQIISLSINSVATLSLLVIISSTMTLFTIPILVLASFLPYIWIMRSKAVGKKALHANKQLSTFLHNRLRFPKLIKISTTQDLESKNFFNYTNRKMLKSIEIKTLGLKTSLVIEPAIIGLSISMIYVGQKLLGLAIGEIILFIFLVIRLMPLQRTLLTQLQSLSESKASISQVLSDIKNIEDSKETDRGKKDLEALSKSITLKNISFSYNDDYVLKNINLVFKINEITCIFGPSGSGKSTLIDLLPNIRTAAKGEILFDNTKSTELTLFSIRKQIAYVPQSPMYLGTSIIDQIAYGYNKSSEQKARTASILSGADEFISRLDNGYYTSIGEDAVSLSGGQKQRVDIARALYSEAKVLILDEPTSDLDIRSVEKFYNALKKIKKEKNMIIIIVSHDAEKMNFADKFVYLNKGSIEAEGSYQDILKKINMDKK